MNDLIRVKLSDKGYQVWADSLNALLPKSHQIPVEQLRRKADEHGYCEFIVWDCIATFGPAMAKGNKDVIIEIVETVKYKHLITDWALILLAN